MQRQILKEFEDFLLTQRLNSLYVEEKLANLGLRIFKGTCTSMDLHECDQLKSLLGTTQSMWKQQRDLLSKLLPTVEKTEMSFWNSVNSQLKVNEMIYKKLNEHWIMARICEILLITILQYSVNIDELWKPISVYGLCLDHGALKLYGYMEPPVQAKVYELMEKVYNFAEVMLPGYRIHRLRGLMGMADKKVLSLMILRVFLQYLSSCACGIDIPYEFRSKAASWNGVRELSGLLPTVLLDHFTEPIFNGPLSSAE
nr:MAG: hypothetical protein [Chemarfal virus 58]